MSLAFSTEKQVAITAVRRACIVTSAAFNNLVNDETLTKDDNSPVTVADYAAQAVINIVLSHTFPGDPIVAEEDSEHIRGEDGAPLRTKIVELVNAALTADITPGDSTRNENALLDAIDRGNHPGGREGRMWVLDPIDGTEGFLCGEQYAVCLALVVDAKVELGVIGCPNLPVDYSDPTGPRGRLFVAVQGQGAEELTLAGENPTTLSMPSSPPDTLKLIKSMATQPAHWTESILDSVSSSLQLTKDPIRMHSQARYCSLARGDGDAVIRMPSRSGYPSLIWDHAPGMLLVQESGGIVTDLQGRQFDFGLGRTLGANLGIIATGADVHAKVLEAVRIAQAAQQEE